jgi:PPOX class probable F420-dependent enzyme
MAEAGAAPQPHVGGLQIRRPTALDPPALALVEAKNVCTVCTRFADGTIHAQPVWVDTDGEVLLLNGVADRAWVRNLERDPRVTCTTVNLGNPYEFLEVRGRAEARGHEAGERQIDFLAKKYLDLDVYPFTSPAEPRLLFAVIPERIVHVQPESQNLDA